MNDASAATRRSTLSRIVQTVAGLAAALLLVVGFAACDDGGGSSGLGDRIALYTGAGSDGESLDQLEALLGELGYPVDRVDGAQVNSSLDDYRLLVLPGGEPDEMSGGLALTGRARIRDLLRAGGGLLAVGGGSYLAAESATYRNIAIPYDLLALYDGEAVGPLDAVVPGSDAQVEILDTDFDPSLSSPVQMQYENGPAFRVSDASGVFATARYTINDQLAAIVLNYGGFGRVALCSAQPEENPSSEEFLAHLALWALRDI